jgi:hypothetical protein
MPMHPENNEHFYYGNAEASTGRRGRLVLHEDGSGAEEYFYGKMGEVTQLKRTFIVPNQAVATYTTSWNYDNFNRLLSMTYPDKEQVAYGYNTAGQPLIVQVYPVFSASLAIA